MKKTSIAALRSQLGPLLEYVAKGKEIEIQKRNVPIAKLVPIRRVEQNKTKLGSGKGSVKFLGDVVSSAMAEDWEMDK